MTWSQRIMEVAAAKLEQKAKVLDDGRFCLDTDVGRSERGHC